MLAKAAEKGRQIKWKYVVLLIFLALAAIFLCWYQQNPWYFVGRRKALDIKEQWIPAPAAWNSQIVAAEGQLYIASGNRLTVLDAQGSEIYSREEAENVFLQGGAFALAYVPLGQELVVFGENGAERIPVTGGVDAAFAGSSHVAVVTAGSGYLTKTVLYDRNGTVSGEIGLINEAMVFGAFFSKDKGFAGISYGIDGKWRLCSYSLEGNACWTTILSADKCMELRCIGDHPVIRTDRGLLFYSEDGEMIGEVPLGSFVSWDAGEENIIAVIVRIDGDFQLLTLTNEGVTLGKATLPDQPNHLIVSGERIFILDAEKLRIYNIWCAMLQESDVGARAASMVADHQSVWLLGNGELMKIINS